MHQVSAHRLAQQPLAAARKRRRLPFCQRAKKSSQIYILLLTNARNAYIIDP
nr:MAG TPA: hypothetical protein [Caudoviricetes sp.]